MKHIRDYTERVRGAGRVGMTPQQIQLIQSHAKRCDGISDTCMATNLASKEREFHSAHDLFISEMFDRMTDTQKNKVRNTPRRVNQKTWLRKEIQSVLALPDPLEFEPIWKGSTN